MIEQHLFMWKTLVHGEKNHDMSRYISLLSKEYKGWNIQAVMGLDKKGNKQGYKDYKYSQYNHFQHFSSSWGVDQLANP